MAERLTQKRIDAAVAAGVRIDIRDAQTPGLMLRVWGPGRWSWGFRRGLNGRDHRLDLGDDWTLEQAREIAQEATRRFKHGPLPITGAGGPTQDWLEYMADRRALRDGRRPQPLPAPAPKMPASMPWDSALAQWAAEVARTRRQSTADGYRRALRVSELKPWARRPVSEFRIEDAAEALRAIASRGAERQAELTCTAIRQFFGWLGADDQRRRMGVEKGRMDDLEAPERTLDESDDGAPLHVPDAREVGLIVRWLREPQSAPERDRLAALLLVYSAQRRAAVAGARKADFEPAGDLGGLWNLPPQHRKSASILRRRGHNVGAHVVPLPPAAWAIVQRAIELSDGDHLFMPKRDRRKSQPSLHMDASRLTHLFREIPGCHASPHDMRRAFGTTYARLARLKVSDVKTILDHSEGLPHGDVTAEHYCFLDGTHEKWPLMQDYVAWVEACAASQVRQAAE